MRGFGRLNPGQRGTVASIGNFDGVHRGHQAVLEDLRDRSRTMRLPSTVMLFEPMPQEYFAGVRPPARLTRFSEKWPLLAEAGVDRVLCLRFGPRLAEMAPEEFIDQVLVQGLGVRHLAVGDDFRFGRERRGDFALLQKTGRESDFEVSHAPTLTLAGERVSSTRIRELLAEGELQAAAELLGRPYALSGRVMYGERLGRKLGFPTVNLALRRRVSPVSGIFAARVHGAGSQPRDAAAYIGRRPAAGGVELMLEAHLPGFTGELYGRRLKVELLQRLREDRHFDSLDALAEQMRKDSTAALAWLAQYEKSTK
ncbi:MAG TPA: bifunctional riboflavin kinase/FAD synthetase [Gammaproteobacteria bacterium]|nr:bifunctional riboflavin kinase/FAD synthetase [Gammaproteobacteria bacterium]